MRANIKIAKKYSVPFISVKKEINRKDYTDQTVDYRL